MITLERGTTRVQMMDPRAAEPYYRGTRFDRTGIILDLVAGGHRYVQPWQRRYDPWSHDAVSGPAEEFLPTGAGRPGLHSATSILAALRLSDAERGPDPAGETNWLKIGVGLLQNDGAPYDRFKLYEVLDSGHLSVVWGHADGGGAGPVPGVTQPQRSEDGRSREQGPSASPTAVAFRHVLDGFYDYRKTVEIPADGSLRLTHALRNDSAEPLDTYVYCHNFFILDGAPTGHATRFEFPWRPIGDWRAPYDSVRLTERGIAFDRDLRPDETVFMGNLRPELSESSGYRFLLHNLENGLRVEAACDRPMDYAVFWSNADVSCLEPYLPLHLNPGETARWTLDYRFC